MLQQVRLFASTAESLELPIKTNDDPTADPPEFSLSASMSAPGTFYDGEWSGSFYDPDTRYATAVTPLIGTGQTLSIRSGDSWVVWVRVTLDGEAAVWPVGQVLCP
jgi:hypothetical protein